MKQFIEYSFQKILIVNESPESIKALAKELHGDYQIVFATSEGEVIQVATSENPPDLILIEIAMTKMDPYELCRNLKNNRRSRHIPVMLITGRDEEYDEGKGFRVGAADYLIKPFDMPLVRSRVKTLMDLAAYRKKLEKISHLDGLTGLPNYRRFMEVFEKEWRRGVRSGRQLSLVMVDMDYFNLFNQHFGPTAGDDCLKQIATILLKSIRRPADFIARYGGEEFTIILPETHLKGAVIVAENIRQRIESLRINIDSYTTFYKLTVSVGVGTVIPMRNMSSEVFLQAVYRALQEAKREGRNRVKKLDVWFGGYY